MATATTSTIRCATEERGFAARPSGLSVIIPAYNYARFLPKAIDSALQQTYREIEVIVVDDGSTDNTSEIVAAFARRDPRVRYVYQENAGLPAARNTGILNAKYDPVGFLDADDIWLPEFLSRVMDTFACLPPEFAIVACRATYIDGDDRRLTTKQLDAGMAEEIPCRDIILKTRFSPSAVVAKKAALSAVGNFDVTLRSSEDRDMWMRIAARYRVHLLSQQLVLIRRHPGNMSKHADRMKFNGFRVIGKAWSARLVPHHCGGFWLKVLSFHFYQAAWMYHDERRRGCAIRDLLKSILLWPWFPRPGRLNEPILFRLRSLRHFLSGSRKT
jgi:glycosyltransferase involved in cell wall biosynthesis